MAFVTRSERKIKNMLTSTTNLGPGEYENEEIKQEARLLHKISNIYKHMSKNNNLEIIIPFNSTGLRSSLTNTSNTPGPGTYTDIYSFSRNNKREKFPSLNNEIIFVEENGNLIPKFKNETKGFLSSQKRFNNLFSSNSNENVGPGCYQIGKNVIKTKVQNMRYGRIMQSIGNKASKSLDNCIPTIPDKNRGEFKYVNGEIKEIKKKISKGNQLGPGEYNVSPKWNSNAIDWKYGLKKENKNIDFKKELINSLNENNSLELKLDFIPLKQLY